MKSILFLAIAGTAIAQDFAGIPACATSCLSSAITAAGCAINDVACQCGPTQFAISTKVAPCLIMSASCKAEELVTAADVGGRKCVVFSATRTSSGGAAGTTSTTTSTTTGGGGGGSTTSGGTTPAPTNSPSQSRTGGTTPQSTNGAAVLGAGALVVAFMGAVVAL